MKVKQIVVTAFLSGLLVVWASTARAQTPPSIPIGTGHTLDKPQSKLWYTVHPTTGAVTWWAILSDSVDLYFHKLVNSVLQKQTFPHGTEDHARVDADNTARADVLWTGTHLFVLLCKGTTPSGSEQCNSPLSLSKYTYNPDTQIYTREAGFPVSIPISSGSESATIAQDSTGRLWIAYDPGTAIRVLWSDPQNHTSWTTTGGGLAVNAQAINSDDLTAVVAFNNSIGVIWSNQSNESMRFRIHRDGDAVNTWQTEELVAQGGDIADDHINLAVTDAGDILAAVKSSSSSPDNTTNLFVRWYADDSWEGPFFVTADSSRANVVFDQTTQDVYVVYTGSFDSGPRTIFYKVANLSQLLNLMDSDEIDLISVSGQDINNVTSTKQAVCGTTGLLIAAKDQLTSSASRAYYAFAFEPDSQPGSNTPPNAADDSVVTAQGASVSISVLANDTDTDCDTLTIDSVTQPTQPNTGTVSINEDQKTVTYTPVPGFTGTAVFTYTVRDGRGLVSLTAASVSVTVTAQPVSTGFTGPTANAPVTSSAGDNNGFQTSAANAHANDGSFAVDTNSGTGTSTSCTNSGKDKHIFSNYNLPSLPANSTIKGIEVRLDARADSASGSPKLCVEISWNGGTTWTTAKSTPTLTTSEATYVLGSATDLWGRTWGNGEFSNANFRVRLISVASSTSRDFSLDWVAVNVTYQP
jgi:hypothetical protein